MIRGQGTPLSLREDVHVWAEVRIPNGHWVAVEPTPDYELLPPTFPWSELIVKVLKRMGYWVQAAWQLPAGWKHLACKPVRRAAEGARWTWSAWLSRSSRIESRGAVCLRALRMVERRARWAGHPRPPRLDIDCAGIAPRNHAGSEEPRASLLTLIALANWAAHAPDRPGLRAPRPHSEIERDCHQAVRCWTVDRFRVTFAATAGNGGRTSRTIMTMQAERQRIEPDAIEAVRTALNHGRSAARRKSTSTSWPASWRGDICWSRTCQAWVRRRWQRCWRGLWAANLRSVQCTPDLLPGDITGFRVFDQQTRDFEFLPGPVFADVLLADEINRTTPRTQSALLEAMAERQVTIDNVRHVLSETFFVIATQNPVEQHGTYPLPGAQLDRFAMKLRVGYPGREHELAMLESAMNTGSDEEVCKPARDRCWTASRPSGAGCESGRRAGRSGIPRLARPRQHGHIAG